MQRRTYIIAAALVFVLGGLIAAGRYFPVHRPLGPATPLPTAINETNLPLTLPPGFKISVFAKNLPGARVMRFDRFGNLWVSRTRQGAVTLLEIDRETGAVRSQDDVFEGLSNPHGLALDPERGLQLYIAEEHRLWRVTTYSDDPGEELLTLPSGGGHFTRTVGFGPDGRLYVAIGSSCNVCRERDDRRAAILAFDPSAKTSEIYARGLRNAVFFAWDSTRRMWASDMGRDWLGDELPPDELNVVEANSDYGWPVCYGRNIHDGDFDKNVYIRDPCADKKPSIVDIPAHSAPLGLAFVPASSAWPEEYWHDLLVAYHGSWNRSRPTGYKVVRHKFDGRGSYEGVEDFITGWLSPQGALGRPVDILIQPDGTMLLSDDHAGVIYKITWQGRRP